MAYNGNLASLYKFVVVKALTIAFTISAFAQQLEQNAESESLIESIIVTGSLIPRGDFVSKAPISTISSDQFELSNISNVENLVNSMPQVIGGNDRSSTWGSGIASANLRGLGENRTLVLVNSRRFVPTFPDGGTVDLNFIPAALVDRVEILTGGASAAYGSDALAGVINFILKEETVGWEVNIGSEMSQEQDGEIFNFNLTNGGSFASDKGRYMVHMDILERNPIYYTDREISAMDLVDCDKTFSYSFNAPSGAFASCNADEGTYLVKQNGEPIWAMNQNATFWHQVPGFPIAFPSTFDNEGNLSQPLTDLRVTDLSASNEPFYQVPTASSLNANGQSYLQLPQERLSLKGKVSYDLGGLNFYADIYYSNSSVPFSFEGPGLGLTPGLSYSIPIADNPYWTDATKQFVSQSVRSWAGMPATSNLLETGSLIMMRSFSSEYGASTIERDFVSKQFEIGMTTSLSGSWNFETFIQTGEIDSSYHAYPLLDPAKIQQAVMVTELDGVVGCLNPADGCIPLDLWSDNVGKAAATFIQYPIDSGKSDTSNRQDVFMATLSGNSDWLPTPGDPGPVGIIVGLEYLEITTMINTPDLMEQGFYEGFAEFPQSLDESIGSTSFFSEILLPIAADLPGINFLEAELGLRITNHSVTGSHNTYKFAFSYYPADDFFLRGSYNYAMRSPAINELYQSKLVGRGRILDPCTNGITTGIGALPAGEQFANYSAVGNSGSGDPWVFVERNQRLEEICISTGLLAEQLYQTDGAGDGFGVLVDIGGDPDLNSEQASTFSAGFVWTPFEYDDLSISLDYFDIQIEEFIALTPINVRDLMQGCFVFDAINASGEALPQTSIGGVNSSTCNSLRRDESGKLTSLFMGLQNLGSHDLQGWDLNLTYGRALFNGYLNLDYFATKLVKRTIEDDTYGEMNFDCLGLFNGDCEGIVNYPVPEYKHRITANWSTETLDLQLVWRHISSLRDGNDAVEYFTERLDAYSLVNFSGRYRFDKWAVIAGINNILNKSPQPIGSNSPEKRLGASAQGISSNNTYPAFYDVYGRTFFLKLESSF